MKRFSLIITVLIINFLLFKFESRAQSPDWLWAKGDVGLNSEEANAVAVDKSGNVYVTGFFKSSTLTFGANTLKNIDSTGVTSDDLRHDERCPLARTMDNRATSARPRAQETDSHGH